MVVESSKLIVVYTGAEAKVSWDAPGRGHLLSYRPSPGKLLMFPRTLAVDSTRHNPAWTS